MSNDDHTPRRTWTTELLDEDVTGAVTEAVAHLTERLIEQGTREAALFAEARREREMREDHQQAEVEIVMCEAVLSTEKPA